MIRRFNAFSDNYIWGIEIHKTICIVDPGQSYEVLKHLENFEHFFSIGAILVTHRHHDHIGGIKELAKSRFAGSEIKISLNESPIFNQMPIFGPTDCQRYGVKHIVADGDIINIGDNTIEVLDKLRSDVKSYPGVSITFGKDRPDVPIIENKHNRGDRLNLVLNGKLTNHKLRCCFNLLIYSLTKLIF